MRRMSKTRPRSKTRAVGILVDSGLSPVVMPVVEAASRAAWEFGWDVYGIDDGFEGLVRKKARRITRDELVHLGRASRLVPDRPGVDPFAYATRLGKSATPDDRSADVRRNVQALGLAGLIAAGGDGTLTVAERLHRRDIPVVGVPVAIENDVPGTASAVGFDTAVTIAVDALERIQATAAARRRLVVAEVLGRNAGWIALHAGLAGGADVILIPETPFSLESVCESLRARDRSGRVFPVVVVAEGARPADAGLARPNGTAAWLAGELARRLRHETATVAVGALQLGGAPSAADRLLGLRLGAAAMRLVNEGLFGNMIALRPPLVGPVPLHQVVGRLRPVPPDADLLKSARDLGIGLGA